MPLRRYTKAELQKMAYGLGYGMPLSALGIELDRTPYGIAAKMRSLSARYPDVWNPKEVTEYTRSEMEKHKGRGNVKEHKEPRRARKRQQSTQALHEQREQRKSNQKRFPPYLKEFLNSYQGTYEEFAAEMSVHPSLVSHYLAGRKGPSRKFLERMSGRFSIPYETLESFR